MFKNNSLTTDQFLQAFPSCPICNLKLEYSGYSFNCPLNSDCNRFYGILNFHNKKLIDEIQLISYDNLDNNYYGYFYPNTLDQYRLQIINSQDSIPPDPWSNSGFPASIPNIIKLFQNPPLLFKYLLLS